MAIVKSLRHQIILNINTIIWVSMNTIKKLSWFCCLLMGCTLAYAASADSALLQRRLAKISNFSGTFVQQVKAQSGQLVQEGRGQLLLKKPYFFNWKMQAPDKMTLISDGKTLWMYTNELEQVTLMKLSDLVDNRLLLLLTTNDSRIWKAYQVQHQGNQFTLIPKNNRGQHFEIDIDNSGKLKSFAIIEEDGQRSSYQFTHQKTVKLPQRLFVFHVPKGVIIDDQR